MENYVVLVMKDVHFNILGYNCCTSINPEIVYTDENGSWRL